MVLDLDKGTFKIYEEEEKDNNRIAETTEDGSLKGKYLPIIALYYDLTKVELI